VIKELLVASSGRGRPEGGSRRARSLRSTFSQAVVFSPTFFVFNESIANPPILVFWL
jgi:hypothetical protein